MLRQALLAASRSGGVRRIVETAPYSRSVVRRFVAGETSADVLEGTDRLISDGLLVTIDHLGEDTVEAVQAKAITAEYERLLERIAEAGYGARAEVSVKLTALGQLLDDGERTALDNARRICAAARNARTTVTLDMEDHTTVDSTLRILKELCQDFPDTGAVIQAYLRRAEEYCADLAHEGSRVRLCKGAYNAPDSAAFTGKDDVDKSYVRCMRVLMAGRGYPMLATHDPRLIEIAGALAVLNERTPDTFEYQMLYGIRPNEQRRLAELGGQVRVYIPYGEEWYGYLMRRLAERPANVGFFLRSLASKS
ncbi:proline dehydrogenase family protein [Actinoallomurus purpureus]|uniref:proline dehydrogenase family protein n=1 Tax=Actinoallomurus purpureus TaxID=478114 RepID=UPI0020928B58|nr:proline dehydrogenase family protein [Actinoallomurus purpureus]MCO6004347.1 proline dehydrogenase family protein [Actinoallomurus purpureus]